VHIPLSALRGMDGASLIEETWLSEPGRASTANSRARGRPLNTRSVPLDVGYSNSIPEVIRRAVILRDKHCAWPGGCDRRPAVSDVPIRASFK